MNSGKGASKCNVASFEMESSDINSKLESGYQAKNSLLQAERDPRTPITCLIGLIRPGGGRLHRILGECIPMQVLASSFEFLFGELAAILHLAEGVEAED